MKTDLYNFIEINYIRIINNKYVLVYKKKNLNRKTEAFKFIFLHPNNQSSFLSDFLYGFCLEDFFSVYAAKTRGSCNSPD